MSAIGPDADKTAAILDHGPAGTERSSASDVSQRRVPQTYNTYPRSLGKVLHKLILTSGATPSRAPLKDTSGFRNIALPSAASHSAKSSCSNTRAGQHSHPPHSHPPHSHPPHNPGSHISTISRSNDVHVANASGYHESAALKAGYVNKAFDNNDEVILRPGNIRKLFLSRFFCRTCWF